MISTYQDNKQLSILEQRSANKLTLRKKKLKDEMSNNKKYKLLFNSIKDDCIIKRINICSFKQIDYLANDFSKKNDIYEKLTFCNILLEGKDPESNLFAISKLYDMVDNLNQSKLNIYITSSIIEKLLLLMMSYKNDLSITYEISYSLRIINCYIDTITKELSSSNKYLVFLIDLLMSTNSFDLKNNIFFIISDGIITNDISFLTNNYDFLKFVDFLIQETNSYNYIPNKHKRSLICMISQILLKLTIKEIKVIEYDKLFKLIYFYFSLLKYEQNISICEEILSSINEIMDEGEYKNELSSLIDTYKMLQKELNKCKYDFEAINKTNFTNKTDNNQSNDVISQLYSYINHPNFTYLFIVYHYIQIPNIEDHIIKLIQISDKAFIKREATLNFNFLIYFSEIIVKKLEKNEAFNYSIIILSNISFCIENKKLNSYNNSNCKLLKETIKLIDYLYESDQNAKRCLNDIIMKNQLIDELTSILNSKTACNRIKKVILQMILNIMKNCIYIVSDYLLILSDVFDACVGLVSEKNQDLVNICLEIIEVMIQYNDCSKSKLNIKEDLLQCGLCDRLQEILSFDKKGLDPLVQKRVEEFHSKYYDEGQNAFSTN